MIPLNKNLIKGKTQKHIGSIDTPMSICMSFPIASMVEIITGIFKGDLEPLNIFLIQNEGKGPPGG